jgi:hypothetical protein
MSDIDTLREGLQWANEVMEMTMADVTSEMAHWLPPGNAHPVGASYVHAVVAQDTIVNAMIKSGAPLMASTWAGKTGCSAPQFANEAEWARSVKVDLPAFREYAKAVYAASEECLNALTEADLQSTRDLSQTGMGVRTVRWMFNALVIGHMNNLAGEISAAKGAQGAKGYPF